ncbi:hypothetical protein L3X38_000698 [Prunus dulcis]|uniref:EDR1/CTR1/ARMC3-like peptidase-like domain-containing protein n=1 Tax=Prunus dulcis TaxID=3755 RepID=A0AAD4ZJI4_PRUDU|nr:hypothetical protein L3X38_000698 [Prunus dulcis]
MHFQIPSWICCNLEGNGKDTLDDDCSSSSVEMDVYETPIQKNDESLSRRDGECKPGNTDHLASESYPEGASDAINLDDDDDGDKDLLSREVQSENVHEDVVCRKVSLKKELDVGNCSSVSIDSNTVDKSDEKDFCEFDASLIPGQEVSAKQDEGTSSEISKSTTHHKRPFDGHHDNLRQLKYPRSRAADSTNLSVKYSELSFCSTEDSLSEGFYDAGRDRPFMPLEVYEQNFHLDSHEVFLVDKEWDAELDAILRSAQESVYRLYSDGNQADELQIALFLALFVSDHFGGTDRGALVEWARKANPHSDYSKPFVCTCPTGNMDSISLSTKPVPKTVEDIGFSDRCEKSLRSLKARRKSIVIPIGTLQFGVCRHRALLFKYLCDRLKP